MKLPFIVKLRQIAAVLSLSLMFTFSASAQTVTFAQFFEQNGTQDFVFNNLTTSGTFNQVSGGSPIFFLYQNIAGLPPSLVGIQSARLYITTVTTQPGSVNGGTLSQPLDQTVIIQIIRDTPAPPGVGGGDRTNLLTAVFSPNSQSPSITGANGGNSATMSATTPDHTVTFGSHFLSFASTTQRNLAFSFSSLSPSLSLGAGSFLQSMSAAGSGTFASNPVPIYQIPSSSGVSVEGRIMDSEGRGIQNATVTLTDQDGEIHRATSSSFGNFRFEGLTAGQTVVVTVGSKRFSFAPRVVTLNESIGDLDFLPSASNDVFGGKR